ncbi:hypothetical protein [Litorimonas haliclonae]|uniref:hypothetical protein n=1 Tax=Litorimonas haliclonae TaxID=2081977 RepID=UPI0039F0ED1E
MLPPILEIFIVWHPDDASGDELAKIIFDHFMHGPTFSGVIGGGIQVSLRSSGWGVDNDAPRPIYSTQTDAPNGLRPAQFVAIVPLIGTEMAAAVEDTNSAWHRFLTSVQQVQTQTPETYGIFPYLFSKGANNKTTLGQIFREYQYIASGNHDATVESNSSMLCRDLTQGIAQLVSPDEMDRLTAFISHTKHHSVDENDDVDELIELVRRVIGNTRLNEFFDASDLQPGSDWEAELRARSGTSAMLALRTDLYSSREWCQREVAIAKVSGMPLIMVDAIGSGEERGSFLMDHVPRVAVRKIENQWQEKDVYRALNLLVDECLKRALWMRQKELAQDRPELDVAWWAPHAPELLTLFIWIKDYLLSNPMPNEGIRILHPDPPLGPEEREVLINYARSTELTSEIDIMTPRQLATRGG